MDYEFRIQFKKNAWLVLGSGVFLFVFLIFLDQAVKYYIFSNSFPFQVIYSFGILPFKNFHFAFSLPVPALLMYFIYFSVLVAVGIFLVKNFWQLSLLQAFAWVFVLAGIFSNIGERILLGYVRDFLYIFSGIFNLADLYILSGILFLFKKTS